MTASETSGGIQVIARAMAILKACKERGEGLSLGQIAERVGLPRSTVQRIVSALANEGLLLAGGEAKAIRLGPQIHALADSRRFDVVEACHPYLKRLSEQLGETVDLALFRHDHLVFVDQIAGPRRLRTVSAVGETFPLHCTANGKAALALLDDEQIHSICRTGLARHTAATKVSVPGLMAELARIRQTGVATDIEEHSSGICAVGMAFGDGAGSIYAISVPMPSVRFDPGDVTLSTELRKTTEAIAARLRGR